MVDGPASESFMFAPTVCRRRWRESKSWWLDRADDVKLLARELER